MTSRNAIEVDSSFVLLSTAAEVAAGVLRYESTGSGVTIDPGDVLVGATQEGGGYLRRVTSVSGVGTVVAQTEPATFNELVDSARIDIVVDETMQGALRRAALAGELDLPEGMTLAPDGRIALSRFPVNFVFEGSGQLGGSAMVSAHVTGSLTVLTGHDAVPGTPTLEFTYESDFLGIPELFQARGTAAVEFDAAVTTSVAGDLAGALGWEHSRDIFSFQVFPARGCAWHGPLCYSVSVVVEAYAAVTAEASASVTQNAFARAGVHGGGVVWGENGGGWRLLGDPFSSAEFGTSNIAIDGNLGIRFGMRPKLVFEVYEGLANASAGVDGALTAGISANFWQWSAESAVVLDVFAAGELTFWGLTDESVTYAIPIERKVIASTTGVLARLAVTPAQLDLGQGENTQASATGFSLLTGSQIPVSPDVEWSTDDGAVATVNALGVVSGIGLGTTQVRGRVRGTDVASHATVRVLDKSQPYLVQWACLSLDGLSCVPSRPVNPGERFAMLMAVEDALDPGPKCGATVGSYDPFDPSANLVTYTTALPNCMAVQWMRVPDGAVPGPVMIPVSPATLDGFPNGVGTSLLLQIGDGTPVRPFLISVSPTGPEVALDAKVTMTFSEPMDPGSLPSAIQVAQETTPGVFDLNVGGTLVADAGGTVVTFTPHTPLQGSGQRYRVVVLNSARNLDGQNLPTNYDEIFATTATPGAQHHVVLNAATGEALESWDVVSDALMCGMRPRAASSAQFWYFDKVKVNENGEDVWWMRNQLGGDARYLEGGSHPGRCLMAGGGFFSGQEWVFTPVGAGLVRLTNTNHGSAFSLGLLDGQPVMVPSADTADQYWSIVPASGG